MPVADARYYKTLLICPDRALASELGPVIASTLPLAPIQDVTLYPSRVQLVETLKLFEPKLCLLDVSSDGERAFSVLSDLGAIANNVPVIAVLGSNHPDLILRCIRQGATEFLIRPFTNEQMGAAFDKIARLFPAPAARKAGGGKVIAVMPAKGASGATTVACSLAHQGKKLSAQKVLLADLDPLTGTVSFLLKLKSAYSFLDVLVRHDALDPDLWKQVVQSTHGIDVLLPPEHLMEGLDELPEATKVLESAQQIYDTVVVDCGSAFGRWNLSVAEACDEIVLVTTNEMSCLQSTQRVLAYFDQARIDTSKVKVVVNRYHREIGLVSDAISTALDTDVFHVIPSDYDSIQKSILEGKPVATGSSFGKSVGGLAERLTAVRRQQDPTPNGAPKSGLLSLFSRS